MNELDLHNLTYAQAERAIENFILLNNPPLKIITGNSEAMKQIVRNLLDTHNFNYVTFSHNLGEIIVL